MRLAMADGCGSVAARGGRRGNAKWDGRVRRTGARGVFRHGCDARRRTARGQRDSRSATSVTHVSAEF